MTTQPVLRSRSIANVGALAAAVLCSSCAGAGAGHATARSAAELEPDAGMHIEMPIPSCKDIDWNLQPRTRLAAAIDAQLQRDSIGQIVILVGGLHKPHATLRAESAHGKTVRADPTGIIVLRGRGGRDSVIVAASGYRRMSVTYLRRVGFADSIDVLARALCNER